MIGILCFHAVSNLWSAFFSSPSLLPSAPLAVYFPNSSLTQSKEMVSCKWRVLSVQGSLMIWIFVHS